MVDNTLRDQLRSAISNAAGKDPLPLLDALGNVVLSIAPTLAQLSWPVVLAAAKEAFNAKPLDVEGVLPLIATGGEIVRDTIIQRNPNREFWADVVWNYTVAVGSERRTVILAVCRLPVEAAPTQFESKAATNNKRLTLKNGVWEVFDIDDNRVENTALRPPIKTASGSTQMN